MTDIITETHFTDLINENHLYGDNYRLPDECGNAGKGMLFSEAVPLCELWWEKNRRMMPGYMKPDNEVLVKNNIYMGRPWTELTQKEILRVIAQWYANVGSKLVLQNISTSQDGNDIKLDELRKSSAKILPVLDTSCTHKPTQEDI
ncbi:MAG: hypothetical protein MI685_09530 [Chlorobiales bacterium]|nr:hypothetical protein [Chlorobiales bacterium]